MIPLSELSRIQLLPAYIGDVSAWKADDAAETLVIAVKNPAIDANNESFYEVNPITGAMVYIGTTQRGKDGHPQPFVLNKGRLGALIPEAPNPGDSGNLASLNLVLFNTVIGAEPTGGTVDLSALTARVAALEAKLAAIKADL